MKDLLSTQIVLYAQSWYNSIDTEDVRYDIYWYRRYMLFQSHKQ